MLKVLSFCWWAGRKPLLLTPGSVPLLLSPLFSPLLNPLGDYHENSDAEPISFLQAGHYAEEGGQVQRLK